MPYVSNYEKILKENEVDYEIINWDRFHIEEADSIFKYRDSKIGHQRNFLDYYKFKNFIVKRLKAAMYDKVIVFGIQLTYFLRRILVENYKNNYVIDFRDYNIIINFFNIKRVINNSKFTVISSPGYREWLPSSDRYTVNHNTQINCLEALKEINSNFGSEKITISCIGAIRDYAINISLIDCLKNHKDIKLCFHGEGIINKDIDKYIEDNGIKNVFLTGRYDAADEKNLYCKSDFINVLRPKDGINNKTALPNRLYNAALYGKPLIAFEGTYLAEQIKKHKLGLVLDSFDSVEVKIENYLTKFDVAKYEQDRISFFEEVVRDNGKFTLNVERFIKS
jgi:hypothetical protein